MEAFYLFKCKRVDIITVFLMFFASFVVNMQYRTLSSTCKAAYTDARKTHHTIIVYTTVFLKMNPRDGNT